MPDLVIASAQGQIFLYDKLHHFFDSMAFLTLRIGPLLYSTPNILDQDEYFKLKKKNNKQARWPEVSAVIQTKIFKK